MADKEKIRRQVLNALNDTYINFQEWAKEHNIYHQLAKLPKEVWGFVYQSQYCNYFVIINKNLGYEMQREVFMHEVEHILYHFPEHNYIIGLDMHHTSLEDDADDFALEMMANIK
ncbi:ImmA/IrrE family metallo-endopeptidase [Sporohalobacter salinus]|uniref:ImmA/IrrE family metallo-endopeptidase n=1 Tax=Sporohalobacter salinus TaxID=1494606 RepID=UPI0019609DB3|nr:hypothetical protein [Sporohalobacter salinus]MBM7623659.1 Zn-dependent peptidase ImmA (M78 family) [Sporohalobacter salinus]